MRTVSTLHLSSSLLVTDLAKIDTLYLRLAENKSKTLPDMILEERKLPEVMPQELVYEHRRLSENILKTEQRRLLPESSEIKD